MSRVEPSRLPRGTTAASEGPKALLPTVGDCSLWFAGVTWDSIRGTDRAIVEALDGPTVWVDPPVSPLQKAGRMRPGRSIEQVSAEPLIVRVRPTVSPFWSRRGVRWSTHRLMRIQVRSALRRLRATPQTVVASYLADVFGYWGDDVVEVLYGTDDYVAGAQLMGSPADWLRYLEGQSLSRVDVVFAVSNVLADRWSGMSSKPVRVLPNGCLVRPARPLAPPVPAGNDLARPTIGVIGQLSERIDIRILQAIAQLDAQLLIVGPRDPGWAPGPFENLCALPTVDYVGVVPADEVGSYLQEMNLGVTPYADSDFNRASFPLKTLEYLGAGLPVVTTELPASRWLAADMAKTLGVDRVGEHLLMASSPREFADLAIQLAAQRGDELAAERRNFADRHSWASRARDFRTIVESVRAT